MHVSISHARTNAALVPVNITLLPLCDTRTTLDLEIYVYLVKMNAQTLSFKLKSLKPVLIDISADDDGGTGCTIFDSMR